MRQPTTVSQALRLAVWRKRAEGVKQYQLAQAAGINPSVFSALVNNIAPIQPDDPRVLRIADVVGVARKDAFTPLTRPKGANR